MSVVKPDVNTTTSAPEVHERSGLRQKEFDAFCLTPLRLRFMRQPKTSVRFIGHNCF